ncbi:hypothetical protein DFH27DRAFT_530195 [Peziza echinospora]|nr:hypothetical protein DFH27DRAFT_530195 [Peziza echinospora]
MADTSEKASAGTAKEIAPHSSRTEEIKTSIDTTAATSGVPRGDRYRERLHKRILHTREVAHGFPIFSFLTVILILLFLAAAGITLLYAQNSSSTHTPWPFFTPNVAISLCAIGVNTLLRHLLSEGSIISWWLTAREGATLTELHWSWEMRSLSGVFRALLAKKAFRRVRWVAVGTLVVAATASHGVLLQRSVKFYPRMRKHNGEIGRAHITARIARDLGRVVTGIPYGSGDAAFTSAFFAEMLGYAQSQDILIEGPGLDVLRPIDARDCPTQAECMAIVRGFGLAWTGTHGTYDYTSPPVPIAGLSTEAGPGAFNATGAGLGFLVAFSAGDAARGELFAMDVLYKENTSCDSRGVHRRLGFSPATVSYLIDISDGEAESRVERAKHGSFEEDKKVKGSLRRAHVWPTHLFAPFNYTKTQYDSIGIDMGLVSEASELSYLAEVAPEINYLKRHGETWEPPVPIADARPNSASYGGIEKGISGVFASHAMFRLDPDHPGKAFDMAGSLTQTHFGVESGSGRVLCETRDCDNIASLDVCASATWEDPTAEILEFIDRLMFVTAVHATLYKHADELPEATVLASVVEYGPVYNIEWKFVIAGLIIPLIAILFVLPTYFGYWKLERKYTGSPMEVAEAFDQRGDFFEAATGEDEEGHGDITDTLEKAGPEKVRYVEIEGRGWVMRKSADLLGAAAGA